MHKYNERVKIGINITFLLTFNFNVIIDLYDQDGRLIALNHTTGIYSTICSQNWDDVDAGVVCRNLGLSQSGQAKTLPRDWVTGFPAVNVKKTNVSLLA
jgi:hypothetical protein